MALAANPAALPAVLQNLHQIEYNESTASLLDQIINHSSSLETSKGSILGMDDVSNPPLSSASSSASSSIPNMEMNKNLSILVQQKLQLFANPRAIDDTSLIALLIAYTILILLGVTGNGLVCAAVIRKPSMRTGRNVYIINLAISDLLLCIFTMPFTLVDIALKFWPLGKLVTIVFIVSSFFLLMLFLPPCSHTFEPALELSYLGNLLPLPM